MLIRKDDKSVILKTRRTESHYQKKDRQWYFNCREQLEFGPFETKFEAMRVRIAFVNCIENSQIDKAVATRETIETLLKSHAHLKQSA
jgi:hypothetical protein